MAVLHVNGEAVPCRGILFDKDGTLLDLLATWGTWADHVLRELAHQLHLLGTEPGMNIAKVLGTSHDDAGSVIGYDPAGPLSMATTEESYGILAWQLYSAGVPWNEAVTRIKGIAMEATNELRRQRSATPLSDLPAFLQQCSEASLKLGVVTSDGASTTGEQLEWLGITNYFHTVVTRDRVTQGKPFPEMAETACRELGLLPQETVIIGDSNADMQLGKRAGLRLSIGISPSGEKAHLLDADTIIAGYHQLRINT